ncbi:MAG: hypothetical protein AAF934_12650 [Bacteroidota bacterium]
MEYFYNHDAHGIRQPYHKGLFFNRRLHIGAKYKKSHWFPDHYFSFNRMFWSAPVVVYSHTKSGYERDSRDIFATTIHELAHVSHWEIGYSTTQYLIDEIDDDPFFPESWATGVEHVLTNAFYPDAPGYDFPYGGNEQMRTLDWIQNESKGYTPIVIDMIDNENQSDDNILFPDDRVSGYTLGQLEDALPVR